MKKGIFMSLFVLSAFASTGFSKDSEVIKETRNVSGFTKVNFGMAGDLYISLGSEFKVVIEGEKSLLEETKTEVSGSKLVIRNTSWHMHGNEKITVYITMPELTGLGVSGSGKAEIKDAIKTSDLDFSVSGSGRIIAGDLTLNNFNVGISGSGDVIINGNGEVKSADIGISGSGNYTAEALKIVNADFSISGSGGCRCFVTGNLDASVSGSGNITYDGNPKVDAKVSGSGRVKSK